MAEGFLYKTLLQDEDEKHSCGKAKTQAGRPVKSESRVTRTKTNALSRYHLPIRNEKPSKQQHLLTKNIELCQ